MKNQIEIAEGKACIFTAGTSVHLSLKHAKTLELDATVLHEIAKAYDASTERVKSRTAMNKSTLEVIMEAVEQVTGVMLSEIKSKTRIREIVWARQVFFWAVRLSTPMSYEEIGKRYNRDHATVLHAMKAIEDGVEYDAMRAEMIERVCSLCAENGVYDPQRKYQILNKRWKKS